jgi:aryl-alcohol dehydrogenase-like predicted oxidoreductase
LSGRDHIASDEQFELIEDLERFARERGISLTTVAIGALLARPVIASVIAGATKPDQVRSNAAAARWTPSADDLAALSELLGSSVR